MWEIILLVAVVVAIAWFVIGTYNRLVAQKNQVDNAWKQIDVQLKRRHDLIPNLVEIAKDFMSYEQETLRQVIEARNHAQAATTPAEAIPAEAALSVATGRFFALAEAYPQLKADANVSRLMEELSSTENKIAFARQFYNDSVMGMNTSVEAFPGNLIASRFGFRSAVYFEVPETEKGAPKVDLR